MPNKIKTRAEYDATVALNYSGSKKLLVSPLHFKHSLEKPSEETKALRIGSAVHAAILEPETFNQRYICGLDVDKRTKAGKEAFEAFAATVGERTILTPDEWDMVHNMAISVLKTLTRQGIRFVETETMYQVDYCGTPLKSAIDAVGADGFLYDVKSCESASPREFLSACRSYKYALQQHFYRVVYELATGKRPLGFRFIAVEKTAPWAVAIYELGPNLTSYAVTDFEAAVKLYQAGINFDSWPGYPDEPQVIDIGADPAKAQTPINFA